MKNVLLDALKMCNTVLVDVDNSIEQLTHIFETTDHEELKELLLCDEDIKEEWEEYRSKALDLYNIFVLNGVEEMEIEEEKTYEDDSSIETMIDSDADVDELIDTDDFINTYEEEMDNSELDWTQDEDEEELDAFLVGESSEIAEDKDGY